VEATFDLLVQASGRSGRSGKEGKVILQVYNPEHYAVKLAAKQAYKGFFIRESKFRKLGQYPPYTYLISLTAYDKDEDKAYKEIRKVREFFSDKNVDVLGPSDILKQADYYRYRVIIRGKNLEEMKEYCRQLYQLRREERRNVRLVIDINPLGLDQ